MAYGTFQALFTLVAILFSGTACAGELRLPAPVLERRSAPTITFRLDREMSGPGTAALKWTDRLGRIVEERRWTLMLRNDVELSFPIDPSRAVTALNRLDIHLSVGCSPADCPQGPTEDEATAEFAIPLWDDEWWDYQAIIWQPQSHQAYRTLKAIGFTGGKLIAKGRSLSIDGDEERALLANDLRWYEENIATDFFSPYHRWTPGMAPNWKFLLAKTQHRMRPSSSEPFVRDPSLTDPAWRDRIRERLARTAQAQHAFKPLFYNLGDETGIADLAAYWDFDTGPDSLALFRRDLGERYGSLAALNRQWAMNFRDWADIVPMTAEVAIRRRDGNFSAWADFRDWMDRTFAGALADARDALHAAQPGALAAIEGGQAPGWGGYDYSLLARSVDVMELYDLGNNIDIARSFNPRLAILTTSSSAGPAARHQVWKALLHGSRGLIYWDESSQLVHADGSLGRWGEETATDLRQIRNGLGALLIGSESPAAQIAIHYSPASMRARWIVDQRRRHGRGLALATRSDHPEDGFTRLRQSICDLLVDIGARYKFLSTAEIEQGALTPVSLRALILPDSVALSNREIDAMKTYVGAGGTLIAIGAPGLFDDHVRRRETAPFRGLPAADEVRRYRRNRDDRSANALRRNWSERLKAIGVTFPVRLTDRRTGQPARGVETILRRIGDVTILCLIAADRPARGDRPRRLQAAFDRSVCLYDIRRGLELGCAPRAEVELSPDEPAILALSPGPIPPISVSSADHVSRGEALEIGIGRPGTGIGDPQFVHIDVQDPSGTPMPHYSGNFRAVGGSKFTLPLAVNDATGTWKFTISDILTGRRQQTAFDVLDR